MATDVLGRNTLRVGDTIYIGTMRGYEPHTISGETTQSWLVQHYGRERKVKKATLEERNRPGYSPYRWLTKAEVEEAAWSGKYRHYITQSVHNASIDQLKAIAKIMGCEVT